MVSNTPPVELKAKENKQLVKLLARLLAGYAHFSERIATSAENDVQTFGDLLEGFGDRLRGDRVIQNRHDQSALLSFTETIGAFINVKSTWQQKQRAVAGSFNILAVLKLTDNEVRHSMV